MGGEEIKVPGVLNDADLNVISEKYGISINSNDITQYQLCQVIKWLESQQNQSLIIDKED